MSAMTGPLHVTDTAMVARRMRARYRVSFVVGTLAFKASLDAAYRLFVAPLFAYNGFTLQVDAARMLESYILVLGLALAVPPRFRRPSDFLLALLFLAVIVPTLSLYGNQPHLRSYLYLMLAGFILVLITSKLPLPRVPHLRGGRAAAAAAAGIGVLIALAWLVSRGGLSYFNLNPARVYAYRAAVSQQVDVGFFSYLTSWGVRVFNVALMAWALWRRRYGWFVALAALQLVFFGITSQKSLAFYPFLVLGIYAMRKSVRALAVVAFALTATVLTALGIYGIFHSIYPASLLVRRAFFVPAQMNFAYYDFFGSHTFVRLSDGVFSPLLHYPYAAAYQTLIGNSLPGQAGSWANDGFLATGFMQFGAAGVLAYALIVGMLIRMVDAVSGDTLPAWVALATVVAPFTILFTSADLPTALLTHGIALSVLLLWLISERTPGPDVGARWSGEVSRPAPPAG